MNKPNKQFHIHEVIGWIILLVSVIQAFAVPGSRHCSLILCGVVFLFELFMGIKAKEISLVRAFIIFIIFVIIFIA